MKQTLDILLFIFQAGMFVLQLLDTYMATYSIITLGFCFSVGLSWIYGSSTVHHAINSLSLRSRDSDVSGWERLCCNIKDMSGQRPSVFFRVMWQFVTPILCLVRNINKERHRFIADTNLLHISRQGCVVSVHSVVIFLGPRPDFVRRLQLPVDL